MRWICIFIWLKLALTVFKKEGVPLVLKVYTTRKVTGISLYIQLLKFISFSLFLSLSLSLLRVSMCLLVWNPWIKYISILYKILCIVVVVVVLVLSAMPMKCDISVPINKCQKNLLIYICCCWTTKTTATTNKTIAKKKHWKQNGVWMN